MTSVSARVEPRDRALVPFRSERVDRVLERVVGHRAGEHVRRDHSIDEMAEHHRRRHLRDDFVGGERSRLAGEHGSDAALREHRAWAHRRGGASPISSSTVVSSPRSASTVARSTVGPSPIPGCDVVEELRQRRAHRLSMPPSAVICAESYGGGTPRIRRVTPRSRSRARWPLSSDTQRGAREALAGDEEVADPAVLDERPRVSMRSASPGLVAGVLKPSARACRRARPSSGRTRRRRWVAGDRDAGSRRGRTTHRGSRSMACSTAARRRRITGDAATERSLLVRRTACRGRLLHRCRAAVGRPMPPAGSPPSRRARPARGSRR